MSDGLRILLIDVSAVYWPQWHATANPDGKDAYERTVRKCRELAEGYDRAAICVDAGDSGRSAIFDGYKANREPHPAPAIEQLRRAIEFLGGDGFHVLRAAEFEADDTIATVCAWAQACDAVAEVIIAGADKDLLQLVWGKVRVLSLHSGDILDRVAVIGKLGVAPEQVPCYLALVGDKADNIPGCPNVGAKRAAELLQRFGTLDEIIKATEEGKVGNGKIAENLYEFGGVCQTSRRLTVLRTDAPIDPEILMEEAKREEAKPQEDLQLDDEQPAVIDTTATDAPKPTNGNGHTTALAVQPVPFSMQLEPTSPQSAFNLAKAVVTSRLFSGYGSPEAALMCIIAGREMGVGAITSLRGFYVVRGKLCMSAQLMAGVVLRSGLAEYFEPVLAECNDRQATWVTKRKGSPREQRLTFTMDDAKRAGLTNSSDSNWSKYPKTMLRWRACADLARALYPDVVGNVYTEADGYDEGVAIEEAAE